MERRPPGPRGGPQELDVLWQRQRRAHGGSPEQFRRHLQACQRLRIAPFAHLRDVFERISAHAKGRLHELLPDQWKAARTAVTS
jgi:hypothetical protein